jgi:mRNA interferase MazF
VTERGSICWADLGEARGSKPARRRPVLVIQSDPFNASQLNTTIAAVITSNTARAAMPGNVFLPAAVSGLPKDSVVNVTALVTLDKTDLEAPAGHLPISLFTTSTADSAAYSGSDRNAPQRQECEWTRPDGCVQGSVLS